MVSIRLSLIGTIYLKKKEHLESRRIESKNTKAKLQTGEFGLDMADYMGKYKIIRRMDGGKKEQKKRIRFKNAN